MKDLWYVPAMASESVNVGDALSVRFRDGVRIGDVLRVVIPGVFLVKCL